MRQVTGTIAFRERLLLRPGTKVEVSLLDVSRADAASEPIVRAVIDELSPPPIPFVLNIDGARIDEHRSYSVRATIRRGSRLLFTTDTRYPVLTRGAGNTVELLLTRVGGPATRPDASLTNIYWKLVSIAGERYRHESANREPHLKLHTEGGAFTGFAGCNTYTGRFELGEGMLRFDRLAVTRRACLEGMEVEARFMGALRMINRYEIRGDTMQLFHDDQMLLGFEQLLFQLVDALHQQFGIGVVRIRIVGNQLDVFFK